MDPYLTLMIGIISIEYGVTVVASLLYTLEHLDASNINQPSARSTLAPSIPLVLDGTPVASMYSAP